MLPHPLNNCEIETSYQNKPKFNGFYSRNSLPKIKDGLYVINFDEFKSVGTHWMALYVNGDNGSAFNYVIYFDGFGVEHFSKD